jgi:serine/threonine protein kinase
MKMKPSYQLTIKDIQSTIENKLSIINSQYANYFVEIEQIGIGGFGEVFKVYHKLDHQKYAIKKIPFFDGEDPNNMRAFNEVQCLAMLNHLNIVRYHTSWLELDDKKMEDINTSVYPVLYIQMELCVCNLRDFLMKRNYSGNV